MVKLHFANPKLTEKPFYAKNELQLLSFKIYGALAFLHTLLAPMFPSIFFTGCDKSLTTVPPLHQV